jgi:hypothetical protein
MLIGKVTKFWIVQWERFIAWPEIQRLNRDVVPNPNDIASGLELVIVKR